MLALIPARGGSKGIPGKNVRPLHGKPLIAHTILAAKAARHISRVVVSTDDPEIAEVASSYDAEIPFLRPAELASDDAVAIDTYLYTVDRLERDRAEKIDSICVLLPTAPLRKASDIDAAVELFLDKQAESVVSVCLTHPPSWSKRIEENGAIKSYLEQTEVALKNRQSEPAAYVPNGAIYVLSTSLLRGRRTYYSEKRSYAYVMPRESSIDIDDYSDFNLASLIMEATRE